MRFPRALVALGFVASSAAAVVIPTASATSSCPTPSSTVAVVTNGADSGAGSLRQAFADLENPTGGTICVDPSVTQIDLDSRIDYSETGTLSVEGNGVVVNGSGVRQYFGGIARIDGDPADLLDVTIRDVTFQNGHAHDGGALYLRNAHVALVHTEFRDNLADDRSVGGAIYIASDVDMSSDPPPDNGNLQIIDSSFHDNDDVCSNCGFDGGGALLIYDVQASIVNSSFVNNTTTGPGGAIDMPYGQFLLVANSTFSGNVASGGNFNRGGAIYTSVESNIVYSTFTGNRATSGSTLSGGSVRSYGNAFVSPGSTAPLCRDGLESYGYNFANETANSCGLTATGDSSLDANDAGLATLATGTNGTQYASPGEELIGGVDDAACASGADFGDPSLWHYPELFLDFVDVSSDQIGVARSQPCAIGAIHLTGSAPDAPQNVAGVAGDVGAVTVSWDTPASDGNGAVRSYTVTAYDSGDHPSGTCTYDVGDPDSDTCVVGPLTGGAAYTFSVTATNRFGTGTASVRSLAVTPSAPATTTTTTATTTTTTTATTTTSLVPSGAAPAALAATGSSSPLVLGTIGLASIAAGIALAIIAARRRSAA